MLTVSTILFLIFLISSFVQGEAEKFHVTVGVAFSRHVNSLAIDDNSENIEYDYQLVTEDKKQLYTNTWLKYKWTSNEIYGLPLEGNEGVSIYYIKITTQDSADKRYQEIKIFTSPAFQSYFHQVKVCTHPKTVTHLMSRLDTRYALMEMLAKNLMDTAVENLRLKGFKEHCFDFSFINVDQGVTCNHHGIRKLQNRLFETGDSRVGVSNKLKSDMSILIDVTGANLTLYEKCIQHEHTVELNHELAWLKSVAPALVLALIIGIPVGIACYVGRKVQRRQNRTLQQKDRFLKEEEKRRIARAEEYQKACGLDKQSFDSGISEAQQAPVRWKTNIEPNDGTQIVFHKALDEYIPKIILDKYKRRRRQKLKRKRKPPKTLNPLNTILDIRSKNDMKNLKDIYQDEKRPGEEERRHCISTSAEKKEQIQRKITEAKRVKIHERPIQEVQHHDQPQQHHLISLNELKTIQSFEEEKSQYRKIFDQMTEDPSTNVGGATQREYQSSARKKFSLPERLNAAHVSRIMNWRMSHMRSTQSTSTDSPASSKDNQHSLIQSLKNFVMHTSRSFDSSNQDKDTSRDEPDEKPHTPISSPEIRPKTKNRERQIVVHRPSNDDQMFTGTEKSKRKKSSIKAPYLKRCDWKLTEQSSDEHASIEMSQHASNELSQHASIEIETSQDAPIEMSQQASIDVSQTSSDIKQENDFFEEQDEFV